MTYLHKNNTVLNKNRLQNCIDECGTQKYNINLNTYVSGVEYVL